MQESGAGNPQTVTMQDTTPSSDAAFYRLYLPTPSPCATASFFSIMKL
jgi:hypothetical protein